VDGPDAVAGHDRPHARVHEELAHGHAGRPGAGHDGAHVLEPPAREPARVDERGEGHDRRAVLVVVEDRDVERGDEPLLDLEAARRGDVLEVDAAEGGGDALDRLHDLVHVLGGHADREGVDVAELLEEHGLALHHGHGRLGSDVPKPEHRAAVRHHGDRVALDRELEGLRAIPGDLQADPGDPRGVGHREVLAVAQRLLEPRVDLAPAMELEGAVGRVHELGALDLLDRGEDRAGVLLVGAVDGDVAHHLRVRLDDLHRPDVAARVPDRGREPAEHPRPVLELDTYGHRELRARSSGHGSPPGSPRPPGRRVAR
jgi:hypothetical protein